MAINNKVTWMHSGQVGAPQANGLAGSNGQLLQILDAALINGFNPQTATNASATGDSITLTFGTSHGYVERQVITISGASDENLNGEHTITAITSSNALSIKNKGITALTGTITTKVAPLGWDSIFGSTNSLKRAYRSKNPLTTQTVLYLDMTIPTNSGYHATNPTQRASVSMCEDMTELGVQINSYTDSTNNFAANPNGVLMWYQNRGYDKNEAVSTSVNASWVIVGNGDYFYFIFEWQMWNGLRGHKQRDFYMFGDTPSLAGEADAYSCAWAGITNINDNGINYFPKNANRYGDAIGNKKAGYFISSADGVGGLQEWGLATSAPVSAFSGTQALIANPNPTTNSMVFAPSYAIMSGGNMRAVVDRLLFVPHNISTQKNTLDLSISNGVLLVSVRSAAIISNINSSDPVGFLAFDLRS